MFFLQISHFSKYSYCETPCITEKYIKTNSIIAYGAAFNFTLTMLLMNATALKIPYIYKKKIQIQTKFY